MTASESPAETVIVLEPDGRFAGGVPLKQVGLATPPGLGEQMSSNCPQAPTIAKPPEVLVAAE